jgi:DNA-binding IclR family transcriptional regulator
MYGSKSEKRKRVEKIALMVALAPARLTQAALARALNVAPSTVADDLATLHHLGVLLTEDEKGRLAMFERDARGDS